MTTDPQDRNNTRADQITTPNEFQLGIDIKDIDQAINDYMIDIIVPKLEADGDTIDVPLIYGNAERWKSIQKDGYFRDQRGKIQIPLIVFKRNSVSSDDTMKFFARELSYPSIKKYSSRNRYDRFSALNGITPEYEAYDVTIPKYLNLSYDISIWTNYTEHMNTLIEAYRYASDTYWGDKDKFKFRATIDNFTTEQNTDAGTERIIRTDFTLEVKGYILPKKFNNKPTTTKRYTVKEVKVTQETDLTGTPVSRGYGSDIFILEFLSLRENDELVYQSDDVFTLSNVELPPVPPELQTSFPTISDRFTVYVNGVQIADDAWTVTFDSNTNELTFQFIFANLGFTVTNTDEVSIIGKYKNI